MKDVKIKLEQIIQSLELYEAALAKDGDMSIVDNKKLEAILKRVRNKTMLADGFLNNEAIKKLIEAYAVLMKKYKALSVTKMKSLKPSALANLEPLKKVLVEIDAWLVKSENLEPKFKQAVANHVEELKELKVEGDLVVKVVDGNQLNPASQKEFAKIIGSSDKTKAKLDRSLEKLLAIPEEDRSVKQKEQLTDLAARKETIESFESDILNLIDGNKVRIDRVAKIVGGDPRAANGQATYDATSKELVLNLDRKADASLGAHELLHLVQAKKGKLVFWIDGTGKAISLGVFIDLQDEVDAYKIQYAMRPDLVPGSPKKMADITPAFVKALSASMYGTLPADQHDINSTMTKLNNHPGFQGFVKSRMLAGEYTLGGVKKMVWDRYKNWKFIDFLNDKFYDPNLVKTNAEQEGYVIIN